MPGVTPCYRQSQPKLNHHKRLLPTQPMPRGDPCASPRRRARRDRALWPGRNCTVSGECPRSGSPVAKVRLAVRLDNPRPRPPAREKAEQQYEHAAPGMSAGCVGDAQQMPDLRRGKGSWPASLASLLRLGIRSNSSLLRQRTTWRSFSGQSAKNLVFSEDLGRPAYPHSCARTPTRGTRMFRSRRPAMERCCWPRIAASQMPPADFSCRSSTRLIPY